MVYFFKSTFFLFSIGMLLLEQHISITVVMGLLAVVASNIYSEKFGLSLPLIIGEAFLLSLLILESQVFWVFWGLVVFDLIRIKGYILLPACLVIAFLFLELPNLLFLLLLLAICGVFGLSVTGYEEKVNALIESYDRERHSRYILEEGRSSLLRASREQAHLAELRERNRIARQIHDNLGHALAGVFLQLQAARKLATVEQKKAAKLFDQAIERLGESIDLLRVTVHNLQPNQKVNHEYIQEIVSEFNFCPIDFQSTGDWQLVPATHLELVATNIKEALTNAAKYSNASQIIIRIEITRAYLRLYIKDNGVGCPTVREGMGLRGMRDRVGSVNGNLSVSGKDGFMLVCFLPMPDGRGVFAGTNS